MSNENACEKTWTISETSVNTQKLTPLTWETWRRFAGQFPPDLQRIRPSSKNLRSQSMHLCQSDTHQLSRPIIRKLPRPRMRTLRAHVKHGNQFLPSAVGIHRKKRDKKRSRLQVSAIQTGVTAKMVSTLQWDCRQTWSKKKTARKPVMGLQWGFP